MTHQEIFSHAVDRTPGELRTMCAQATQKYNSFNVIYMLNLGLRICESDCCSTEVSFP